VLRERIVEHVFIGEIQRWFWRNDRHDIEVLRSEFDAGGYDVVLSYGGITRHVQLKTIVEGGRAAHVSIGLRLAAKPSGCVLWIVVTEDLDIAHYRWFGGPPGAPLPDISEFPVTRHSKGNAQGEKSERSEHRKVSKRHFRTLDRLDDVVAHLFGDMADL
tara:strand:- start:822 stop:1301 length:480 start_codon:yes stop_codon:yes gene_type:complete